MGDQAAEQRHERRLLRIYLNDHLMGASLGVELARRSLRNNSGSPLGSFLEQLVRDVAQDRATLEQLIRDLELPVDRLKVAAGVVAERIGRLKLNGRLVKYSDLSRVLELEGLCAGVELKLSLWRTLTHIRTSDARIASLDLEGLMGRAEEQRAGLERHRLAAAELAFT